MIIVADNDISCPDRCLIGIPHGNTEPCRFQHRNVIKGISDTDGVLDGNTEYLTKVDQP